jgi:hypothetical protein
MTRTFVTGKRHAASVGPRNVVATSLASFRHHPIRPIGPICPIRPTPNHPHQKFFKKNFCITFSDNQRAANQLTHKT